MRTGSQLARFAMLLVLCAGLVSCEDDTVGAPVDPTQPAIVRLVPDHSIVTVSQDLTIEVRIENANGVDAAPFHILYDDTRVDFVPPAAEGSFMSQGGRGTTFTVTESTSGDILVAIARAGDEPGASGAGIVASFDFHTIAAGTPSFVFSGASLKDPDNANLPASFINTSVEILP